MHTSGSCSTSFRPFCKCAMRSLSKLMSRGTDVVKNRIFGRYRKQRITFLPLEVQLNILSFLPPQDVLIAKEVCRTWRHIITRHPTSIQRFPVELKIRKRNDGEREVRVQIMQQSELMKCGRQSFPLRFSIALGELHSYNDFLRHCIVRSIVLDGNPCQTRGKAISTRIGMLDADTIHGVVVLLQQLRNSRRLAELHSFSLISWSVGEGERGMIDEMLRLVLSAPLKAFKVDALCGLQGKLSPEILTSLLGNNIQNLMVDFQYFWKCGARESANYRILDELLSVGAGRRLFLKNIPYADNKVTELAERWSMQELPLFEGRLTLKVTNAQRILPLPRSTKQRFNNRHNKHCFVEISVKNKITVQLQTGTEIHSGSPLNLHITAHSAVEDVFSGEKRTKIHCSRRKSVHGEVCRELGRDAS
uniref:F-box domain-containing protein n=1 Tax=Parascaris univalens TaxID=6257 RepID=A0A914ZH02_PARUN